MNDKKLSVLNVAVMYVGAIMGAGFASGRETWQFFGVFGYKGIIGALIFAVVFLITGHVIRCNAKILKTNDMGKIIGKQGAIAKSIRTIMKALAAKENKKITIEFID